MRYLIFLLFLMGGCRNSINNNFQSLLGSTQTVPAASSSSGCSSECQINCQEIFLKSSEFNQCTKLSDTTVHRMKKAVDQMKKGVWNSINEEQISQISYISHSPWIRYSNGSFTSSKKMLIWLAENHNIPQYLDQQGDVLKTVLDSMSSLNFEKGIKDALSYNIEDGRTFLEMLAWGKNEEGFKQVHNVILDICRRDNAEDKYNTICIRQAYCQKNSDIVPDTVNKLKLNLDFQNFDFSCP